MNKKLKIDEGSGNVFRDAGLADADGLMIKADLVIRLNEIIKDQGLTQNQAAKLIGIGQPDLSRILRGHFHGVSVERLMFFLTRLGAEVKIAVKPARRAAFKPIVLEGDARAG